jgi:hypothetical protein
LGRDTSATKRDKHHFTLIAQGVEMQKKLNLAVFLALLASLLLASTVWAQSPAGIQEAARITKGQAGADPVNLVPIGLMAFGIASLGIGVAGYALARRRSREPES